MKLIATKPMSYNSRRLQAGDEFDVVRARHARILQAIGKARLPPAKEEVAPLGDNIAPPAKVAPKKNSKG